MEEQACIPAKSSHNCTATKRNNRRVTKRIYSAQVKYTQVPRDERTTKHVTTPLLSRQRTTRQCTSRVNARPNRRDTSLGKDDTPFTNNQHCDTQDWGDTFFFFFCCSHCMFQGLDTLFTRHNRSVITIGGWSRVNKQDPNRIQNPNGGRVLNSTAASFLTPAVQQ